ncbi:class I adenylate-forming enzyme family protein [Rhodococcus sp. NPDC127530]|uniref:class I adenylate-forming enzyme family protein n=1 Tax=unclassified Rhodococcus (in: high G+C Gram-positive bacteria) TaxID=192944 RepID=UPI0036419CB4
MPPPVSQVDSPAGSASVPVAGTAVELRAGDGIRSIPIGETGEIWVRGPQVTDGYHREPELAAEQFRDGWLRTGDLGRMDEADNLFIVGGAKDMIIYKGYNVYPAHLEEILGVNPSVARSAVVGIPQPEVGETPVAFVVPVGSALSGDALASELVDHVRERVAPYQRSRAVHFVDELPLSPTGKVLIRAVPDLLR